MDKEKQMGNNKKKYEDFCRLLYVPIYTKPWYMDAVCGPENWDVWLYYSGDEIMAAMPFYLERRGKYKYITRPLLTQNNGILFKYPAGSKSVAAARFEEKVISEACAFIDELGVDVFEEQFHYSFTNWLPFFWNNFTGIVRYTYIIPNTGNLDVVWKNISSKQRGIIKKGQRNSIYDEEGLDIDSFYKDYIRIFQKQGMECPYSYDLWKRVSDACIKHDAGKILCRRTQEGKPACVSFIVWDEMFVYKIMGGPIPEYAYLDAYAATTWDEIVLASKMGLAYDFEGSVIKRISKSFREYGGILKPYFRIRKVYNPDVVRKEAEEYIKRVHSEN